MANRARSKRAPAPAPSNNLDEPVSRLLPVWGTWQTPGWGPAAILLFVLALATFSNSFFGQLVLDNGVIIGDDIRLRKGETFAQNMEQIRLIFVENYWWPSLASDLFRPLTTLSYKFNYTILGWGADPKLSIYPTGSILPEGVTQEMVSAGVVSLVGFHVVNLLLHWANSLLVFGLVRRIVPSAWASLFAACVFAVHPVVVESVTNIVGRADLLATFFVLMALILHIRAYQVRGFQRLIAILGMAFASMCGVFCKESAVVIIGAMPLYDLAFASENADRRRWHVLWERFSTDGWLHYLAVMPAVIALFTARAIHRMYSPVFAQVGVDNPIAAADFWTGEFTAIKVVAYYLELLLWPATLSCDYSHHQVHLFEWGESPQDWHMFIGLIIVLATAGAGIMAYVRRWRSFFFLGFFAGSILPTSNLLITIGTIMAERILYLPMVGFVGLVAVVALWWSNLLRERVFPLQQDLARAVLAGMAVIIVSTMAVRSYVANEAWYDEDKLWTNAMIACPESFKVYKGLALVRAKADAVVLAGVQAIHVRNNVVAEAINKSSEALGMAERQPKTLQEVLGMLKIGQEQCRVIAGASELFLTQIDVNEDRAKAIESSLEPATTMLRERTTKTLELARSLDDLVDKTSSILQTSDIDRFSQAREFLAKAKEQLPALNTSTAEMLKIAAAANSVLLGQEIIPMAEKGYNVLQKDPLPLIHLPGQLYLDLGHYYASMGDRAQFDQMNQIENPGPSSLEWFAKAIKILREGEQIDKAVNEGSREARLNRGVSSLEIIDVGNPNVYHDLGVVYQRMGEIRAANKDPQAREDFQQALDAFTYQRKLDPMSSDAYFNSGVCRARLGEPEAAALDLITSLILGVKEDEAAKMRWYHLNEMYKIFAPQPAPIQSVVVEGKEQFQLNEANPVVRRDINKAFYQFIEHLMEANRWEEARQMRQIAVTRFHCPDSVFASLDVQMMNRKPPAPEGFPLKQLIIIATVIGAFFAIAAVVIYRALAPQQ